MNLLGNYNKYPSLAYVPQMVAQRSIVLFCVSLVAVSMLRFDYAMPWFLWVFGIASVLLFFMGAQKWTKEWSNISEKRYKKNLLLYGWLIRSVFVVFIYYYNWAHFENYWGSGSTDVTFYVPEAWEAAERISKDGFYNFMQSWMDQGIDFGDMGYMAWLVVVYVFTFMISDVMIPLLIKSVLGAYTCWFTYKIAKRHFGEGVARIVGVLCMVYPNFIWWTGSMMKETEMLFVLMLYADLADAALMERKLPMRKLIMALAIGTILFSFRTVLGFVAYVALALGVVLSSERVVGTGKKLLIGVLVAAFIAAAMGDSLMSKATGMIEDARSGTQVEAINNKRSQTNIYAKYAGATVMAPLIFTVPFPSMVYTSYSQEQNMQRCGGNYVKNVLSFFTILVVIMLLLSGEWRRHVFLGALLIGYLFVLVFSSFAHSARFHLPAEPFEIIFAGYGISMLRNPTYKRWFNYAMIAEFVFILVWNYIKIKGRGLE